MNKIFLALSNLRHNGETINAGDVFEGALETFESLIKDGVVRLVEGAENLEQAAEIVRNEVAEKSAAATAQKANAPKDTWAPSPEKETAPVVVEPEAPAAGSTTIPAGEAPAVGTGDLPPAPAAPGTDASNL